MLCSGALVPIPNLILVLSQNKLALFCAIVVPLLNKTEPLVSDGRLYLPLNVLQSALLNAPRFVADAVGRLNVCVSVAELIAKSVPLVPVAKYCTCAVSPLRAFKPVENVVNTSQRLLFSVCNVIVLPSGIT